MYAYWKLYFQERPFIVFSILANIVLIIFQCFFSKADLFFIANGFHSPQLDIFFTWYTNLGDGLFCIALCVPLFFLNRLLCYRLGIGFLLSGTIAQVLKVIFHAPRPKTFFIENTYPWFINGVTHTGNHSFPSGHTTTAFVMAAIVSFHSKKKYCILLLIAAFGVAYSRVYLGQHFVQDVAAGSVIGIITAILIENSQAVLKQRPVLFRRAVPKIDKPAEPVYFEA